MDDPNGSRHTVGEAPSASRTRVLWMGMNNNQTPASAPRTATFEADLRPDGHSRFSYPQKIDDGSGKVPLQAIVVSAQDAKAARGVLSQVLDGRSSILPISVEEAADEQLMAELKSTMKIGEPIAAGTLIARTSGSTGAPKGAILSAANLRASNRATEEFLRDHLGADAGPWLLALPAHHIAGLQVILRSITAGFTPFVTRSVKEGTAFSVADFAESAQALRDRFPRQDLHTSLVPAQIHTLLTDDAGIEALKLFSAVLIGGAAMSVAMREELDRSGVRYVHTYGSSETAGGMVYDGKVVPRGDVRIDNADESGIGRVVLSGPMVARGYVAGESADFPRAGEFRTSDLGKLEDGQLTILGRADGAINTGGMKVLPEQVEAAVQQHVTIDGVSVTDVCAVGITNAKWGEAVVALVGVGAGRGGASGTAGRGGVGTDNADREGAVEVTDAARKQLKAVGIPPHLIPTRVWSVHDLPKAGPGKVDRRKVKKAIGELVES